MKENIVHSTVQAVLIWVKESIVSFVNIVGGRIIQAIVESGFVTENVIQSMKGCTQIKVHLNLKKVKSKKIGTILICICGLGKINQNHYFVKNVGNTPQWCVITKTESILKIWIHGFGYATNAILKCITNLRGG